MGLLDGVLDRFGFVSRKRFQESVTEAVKAELDRNLPAWLGETADVVRNQLLDPYVYANQADLYSISPILGTAIDLLANDVSTAKFNVKRRVGEEVRDITNHELEILLRNPNPLDSGLEFISYTVSGYKLNGNAIWWLNRKDADSPPDEIWPIPFSMIKPVPDRRLYIDHYDYFPGDDRQAIPMDTWEIVHFKTYNPDNRFVGMSPLVSLAVTLKGDQAMRRTNTIAYDQHGGAPQSILAFKEFVPPKAWESIKDEKREAAKRNEMMMLRGVGDGVTWLQRQLSNKDMEYIASLKQNLTDVFNRMCPGLLAMLDPSATEANALAARATYSEKTLWPTMETIAQKITSDILPSYGRKLMGEFEDPRIVDSTRELAEQTAYERSHTIEEVRKKYYSDDPIGDERDKLIPAQVIAAAPAPNTPVAPEVKKPVTQPGLTPQPGVTPPQLKPFAEANQQAAAATPDAQAVSVKLAMDELNSLGRLAQKHLGEAVPFVSYYLSVTTIDSIRADLKKCKTPEAIKAVIDKHRKRLTPKAGEEGVILMQGLLAAMNKLEASRK